MLVARFISRSGDAGSAPRLGFVEGESLTPISLDLAELAIRLGQNDPIAPAGERLRLSDVTLVAPSLPTKIVCVGLNYLEHAKEQGKPLPAEPLIFLKPPSALLGPGETIELPAQSQRVEFEGELAVIIGRVTRKVPVHNALDSILGVTCFNDVTARDIQAREKRYTRAKGFDTFGPCGPFVRTDIDPQMIDLVTRVNGVVRQASSTDDMIFSVAEVISFVSHVMTLVPGDIITTGTPSGVGALHQGDVVSVELSGVGVLENRVGRPT